MRSYVLAITLTCLVFLSSGWAQGGNIALLPPLRGNDISQIQINDIYDKLRGLLSRKGFFNCMEEEEISLNNFSVYPGYNIPYADALKSVYPTLEYQITISCALNQATCWVLFLGTPNKCEFNFSESLLDAARLNTFGDQIINILQNGCQLAPVVSPVPCPNIGNKPCDYFQSDQQILQWWSCLPPEWKEAFEISYNIVDPKHNIREIENILKKTELEITEPCNVINLEGCRNMTNLREIIIKSTTLKDLNGAEHLPVLDNLYFSAKASICNETLIKHRFKKMRNDSGLTNPINIQCINF